MHQFKAPIAGNSKAIAKIGNAAMRRSALAYFNKQMLFHELIRGSLTADANQSRTLTQFRPFFLATNKAMSARLTIEA